MSMKQDRGGLSRRDFLHAAGAAGVGSLLSAARLGAAGEKEPATKPAHPVVPTRRFGKTGVRVPILALGGGFNTINSQLLLRQAVEWGVTYWDTANNYLRGKSEQGLGKYFAKRSQDRKKVFLVTKSWQVNPEKRTRDLNTSLERMKTDYIDMYMLHGARNPADLSGGLKAWVRQAKKSGKIKFCGLSTHKNMEAVMQAAAKAGWIDGLMATYNFRLMNTDKMKAAIEACGKAGIGLTAMKVMAKGQKSTATGEAARIERELLDGFIKKGFTDAQARLKAVWSNAKIASACVLMQNMTVLMSNVAAALDKTKLSAAELKLMERYADTSASDYCAGCGDICEQAVAGEPPICDVMRYLMYYNGYGDRGGARQLFAELPAGVRRRLASLDYSAAERLCPQGIAIGKLMREAEKTLA